MTGPEDTQGRKVTALAALPTAIEPPRDLWPQIRAQIEQIQAAVPPPAGAQLIPPRQRGVRLRWLAAAAMVASVAIGVWIGRTLAPAGGATTPTVATSNVSSADAAQALDAAYVSDPRYERQRAALLRSLQAQLAALPPPTRTKVMASLATVEKAKQDLEQALGKDPGNALLQELLINTYQDEMRVLTDVRDASEPGRGI